MTQKLTGVCDDSFSRVILQPPAAAAAATALKKGMQDAEARIGSFRSASLGMSHMGRVASTDGLTISHADC